MKQKHNFLILIIIAASLSTACFRKEDFDMGMLAKEQDVSYDLAVPMMDTRLTIENLMDMDGGLFVPDQDGLVHLIYAQPNVFVYEVGKLITVPNLSVLSISTGNIPYCKVDSVIKIERRDTLFYPINGLPVDARIEEIILDTAFLNLEVNNTLGIPLEVAFQVDNMRDASRNPIKFQYTIPAKGRLMEHLLLKQISLMIQGGVEDPPKIIVSTSIVAHLDQASNVFPNFQYGSVSAKASIQKMLYNSIKGYLGKYPLQVAGVVDVPGLANITIQRFKFYKADLRMITGLFGLSCPLRINNATVMALFKGLASRSIPLMPKDYDVPYPLPTDVPMNKVSEIFTPIQDLLQNLPYQFRYNLQGSLNPEENGNITNVMQRNSKIAFDLICDVPLWLSAENYVLSDTIKFGPIKEVSMIHRFEIKALITNAFPIDAIVSLSFLNAKNQVLFNLLDLDTIAGGEVGPAPDLHVIKPHTSTIATVLDSLEVAQLAETSQIILKARLDSKNKKEVKIYTNEQEGYIQAKMGARAKLQLGGLIIGQK
ncbi:MAG: hypothetical protein RSA02_04955 [Bacteroidales bacterium]